MHAFARKIISFIYPSLIACAQLLLFVTMNMKYPQLVSRISVVPGGASLLARCHALILVKCSVFISFL